MIGGYEAGKSRVIINDAQEVLGQSVANTLHELCKIDSVSIA
jgi:hypothetical protein